MCGRVLFIPALSSNSRAAAETLKLVYVTTLTVALINDSYRSRGGSYLRRERRRIGVFACRQVTVTQVRVMHSRRTAKTVIKKCSSANESFLFVVFILMYM